jgi:uncharacterized protein (TIGR03083 family)
MASDTRLQEALTRAWAQSELLSDELDKLEAADWDRISTCDPWTVRQLVAHVARAAESYLYYVGEGLKGTLAPPQPAEYRLQRMNEIASQDRAKIVRDLREVSERFEQQMSDLKPRQLELLATHSHGPRPLAWFAEQWLAELAFHHLDLRQSLGRETELDESTAAFLLPTLLEWNFSGFMTSGWPRGTGRFRFSVPNQPEASWLAIAAPDSLAVRRGADDPADVTIVGDAAALALLIYGRRTATDLERQRRVRIEGERSLAERFHEIFRGP